MSLTLMYITNDPQVAQIAQDAGVERIWVDMEYIGKDLRQGGMDTVQSHHTVEDIRRLRPVVTRSQLMVRINPIHEATDAYVSTEEEIEQTIAAGADVIMLPYFRTAEEVRRFAKAVNGRAVTMLLVENTDAVANLDEILAVPGIDEVHIGLNDLHLSKGQTFMFELLCDGTVQALCEKLKARGIKYGFGGIARVGLGMLPAEYIITEHYALGSTAAILSRGFCDANRVTDPQTIRDIFIEGVRHIRAKEHEVAGYTEEQYAANREEIAKRVALIVEQIKLKRAAQKA